MNKFIKKQLMKCRINLPDWDDDTRELIIPLHDTIPMVKTNAPNEYTIIIKDYIIHEPDNFTLSANWNQGTKPPEHNMIVKIVENMGKMSRISGYGVNTKTQWDGWLPQKGFDIIQ